MARTLTIREALEIMEDWNKNTFPERIKTNQVTEAEELLNRASKRKIEVSASKVSGKKKFQTTCQAPFKISTLNECDSPVHPEIKIISDYFRTLYGMPEHELFLKKRHPYLVEARYLIMFFSVVLNIATPVQISKFFQVRQGNVNHGLTYIYNRIEVEEGFDALIEKYKKDLCVRLNVDYETKNKIGRD